MSAGGREGRRQADTPPHRPLFPRRRIERNAASEEICGRFLFYGISDVCAKMTFRGHARIGVDGDEIMCECTAVPQLFRTAQVVDF